MCTLYVHLTSIPRTSLPTDSRDYIGSWARAINTAAETFCANKENLAGRSHGCGVSVNCSTRSAAGGNGKRADGSQTRRSQRRDTKRELPRGPGRESQDSFPCRKLWHADASPQRPHRIGGFVGFPAFWPAVGRPSGADRCWPATFGAAGNSRMTTGRTQLRV